MEGKEKMRTKYPGWRTMRQCQRRNAKMDAIWEEYKRLEQEKALTSQNDAV
jgi:hypothetical protein